MENICSSVAAWYYAPQVYTKRLHNLGLFFVAWKSTSWFTWRPQGFWLWLECICPTNTGKYSVHYRGFFKKKIIWWLKLLLHQIRVCTNFIWLGYVMYLETCHHKLSHLICFRRWNFVPSVDHNFYFRNCYFFGHLGVFNNRASKGRSFNCVVIAQQPHVNVFSFVRSINFSAWFYASITLSFLVKSLCNGISNQYIYDNSWILKDLWAQQF